MTMAAPERTDLPVGALVRRPEGLIWRRRMDWENSDYLFISRQYSQLARLYAKVAAEIDDERLKRYGRE